MGLTKISLFVREDYVSTLAIFFHSGGGGGGGGGGQFGLTSSSGEGVSKNVMAPCAKIYSVIE